MATGREIHAEELLAQSAWVRRLARRLLGDETRAEDVAQEVHLAAWSRRAEVRPENLRAWLGGIVRNLVRRQRRSAALRLLHERRAASSETAPDDDNVARMRLQRALADAVLLLQEPHRSAVIQRYLDQRTYTEIADRQGISVEAARKRVSRGLTLLRKELGRVEGGDGHALLVLLFGTTGPVEPLWKPFVTLGGALMGSKLTAATFTLVVAALSIGLIAWNQRGQALGEEPVAAAVAAETASAKNPGEDARRIDEPIEPASIEVRTPVQTPAAAALPEVASAVDLELVLHGRIVDADGRGTAGARIDVRRDRLREYATLDPERGRSARRGRTIARAVTDERGEFAIPLTPGIPYDLWVDAEGFSVATATDRYAGERVDILLQRPARLVGRVTCDSNPVEGARVTGWKDDSSRLALLDGRTDANGLYDFDVLEPGRIRVRVIADGLAPTHDTIAVELVAEATCRLDVALSPGTAVRGTVVDAVSGLPLKGAEVGLGRSLLGKVRTDAGGAFELAGLARDGAGVIQVRAAGYGGAAQAITSSGHGNLELHFALLPGVGVHGRVVDPKGRPLDQAYVASAGISKTDAEASPDWHSTTTDSAGMFTLEDLRLDLDHVLMVVREGYGTELVPLDWEGSSSDLLEIDDVVLRGGGEIRGVAADESGAPLPDSSIRLTVLGELHAVGHTVDELNRWNDDALFLGQRTARTDDLGRFRFTDLAAGKYELELSRHRRGVVTVTEAFDRSCVATIDLEHGESIAGVELVLSTAETIAGVILAPDETPVAGMLVWIFPSEETAGSSVNQVTGPDGRFEFRGLSRGHYSLAAYGTSIGRGNEPPPFVDLRLDRIRSGQTDLEFALEPAAAIRGIVLLPDGLPAAKACVAAYDGQGTRIELCYAEEDGRFALNLTPGLRVDLLAKPAPTDAPYWDVAATDLMSDERGVRRYGVKAGEEGLRLQLSEPGQ